VRIEDSNLKSAVCDGQELGYKNLSDPAYLTFPIQSRERHGQKTNYAGRGVMLNGSFRLGVIWRGEQRLWSDIEALIAVFGHLSSLGFRGRRAMGALAFVESHPDLKAAFTAFADSGGLIVKETRDTALNTANDCIIALGKWLKSWREHGRTPHLATHQPGFGYARRDHNEGLKQLTGRTVTAPPQALGKEGESFRPALGLPIVQYFSSQPKGQPNTVNWEFGRGTDQEPKGRFASPVLLRPHKDAQGKWHALVIFVDAHKWPNDPATGKPKQVFLNGHLNGQPRQVSLELYEQMKADPRLHPFP